jgi:hypothetical protein
MCGKKLQTTTLAFVYLLVICTADKKTFAETSVSMGEQLYRGCEAGLSLEELNHVGVTILSHCPWTTDMEEMKRYLHKAHSLGIKVLPYVSVEKAWELEGLLLERFNQLAPLTAIPYHRAVDPTYHWEWVLVNENGYYMPRYGTLVKKDDGTWEVDWSRWFIYGQWNYRDPPNSYSWYMCSSAPGYREAVVKGVKAVMDMGFDGIFLDNTCTTRLPKCFGPEFGKHEHVDGENTDKSYVKIGQLIYKTVKSYGDDKILMLNSGEEDVYINYRDACMLESYVIGGGNKRWDWELITKFDEKLKDERKHNRAVCALSYVRGEMPPYPDKDNMFYAYACAKLSGFLWSCVADEYLDVIRIFYRASLKTPVGEKQQQDGVYFRHYKNGIVVVNPGEKSCCVRLPLYEAVRKPVELYTLNRLPVTDNECTIDIPVQSGRVIVDFDDAVDNLLNECIDELKRSLKRLPELAEKTNGLEQTEREELVRQGSNLVKKLEKVLPVSRMNKIKAGLVALLKEVQTWCGSLMSIQDVEIQRNCRAAGYAGALSELLTDVQVMGQP